MKASVVLALVGISAVGRRRGLLVHSTGRVAIVPLLLLLLGG